MVKKKKKKKKNGKKKDVNLIFLEVRPHGRRNRMQNVFVVDRFYIALFSALDHSLRSRVILHGLRVYTRF